MRIILPRFYVPEPDPEDRFVVIEPEELTPEARAELIAMRGQHIKSLTSQPEGGSEQTSSTSILDGP